MPTGSFAFGRFEVSSRIAVTGANGLLGRHARAVLLGANGAAAFAGRTVPWEVVSLSRGDFTETAALAERLDGVDVLLHFAGVNRDTPEVVESANRDIAERLVEALERAGATPHVLFANSTHAGADTAYGRGKAAAATRLTEWADGASARFTDCVLPHVFGEGGRPFYNSVTATLCHQVAHGEPATIGEGASAELLHAGAVVDAMLGFVASGGTGSRRLVGRPIAVTDLHERLLGYRAGDAANRYPELGDAFDVALFNTYRAACFPGDWPRVLRLHSDARGTLFEAVKGGGGGQSFLSWTAPGVTRGDHFHRHKVERFLVVSGEAEIRVRHVLDTTVERFRVSGDRPAAVDMPTLHAHSITNVGDEPLLTLFWAHEVFDPERPDTFACPVLDPSGEAGRRADP